MFVLGLREKNQQINITNMEETNNLNQNLVPKQVSQTNKVFIATGVIILVALLGVIFWYSKNKSLSSKQLEQRNIPGYFVLGQGQAKPVKLQDTKDLVLSKTESLGEPVQYTLNLSQGEALKQVLKEMQDKGWQAFGGSTQNDQMTLIKMSNSTQSLFLKVEGGKTADAKGVYTSTVTIIPVNKK